MSRPPSGPDGEDRVSQSGTSSPESRDSGSNQVPPSEQYRWGSLGPRELKAWNVLLDSGRRFEGRDVLEALPDLVKELVACTQ